MTDTIKTLNDFTQGLVVAGWRAVCDAQHEGANELFGKITSRQNSLKEQLDVRNGQIAVVRDQRDAFELLVNKMAVEIEKLKSDLAVSKSIQTAEKAILIKEIEDHTATRSDLAAMTAKKDAFENMCIKQAERAELAERKLNDNDFDCGKFDDH